MATFQTALTYAQNDYENWMGVKKAPTPVARSPWQTPHFETVAFAWPNDVESALPSQALRMKATWLPSQLYLSEMTGCLPPQITRSMKTLFFLNIFKKKTGEYSVVSLQNRCLNDSKSRDQHLSPPSTKHDSEFDFHATWHQ